MREFFVFTILALVTTVGCGGATNTRPRQQQRSCDTTTPTASPTQSRTAKAPSEDVAFTELYGGMIMSAITTPGVVPPSGTAKVRTTYLIRDAAAFMAFKKRVPRSFISKGPDKPNTDPILTSASFDFSKNMLLIVEYDYMWVKPRVLSVTIKGERLLVKARFDDEVAIKQHANGVASYTAVSIPRSTFTPILATN